jgi:hypothetical protein
MSILGTVGVILILGIFFWMVVSSNNETPTTNGDDPATDRRVGYMSGLQGGSIEDAAIAKFAINRGRCNTATADSREVATATCMQIQADLN